MPVGSKTSCSLTVIESQQPAEAFPRADFTGGFTNSITRFWKQDHVPLPLMISLGVKMRTVIRKDMSERSLSKQDHFRQTLLFHRAIPPLQMRVEAGTTRRQHKPLD